MDEVVVRVVVFPNRRGPTNFDAERRDHERDVGQPMSRDPERCGQGWNSTARTRDGKKVRVDLYIEQK